MHNLSRIFFNDVYRGARKQMFEVRLGYNFLLSLTKCTLTHIRKWIFQALAVSDKGEQAGAKLSQALVKLGLVRLTYKLLLLNQQQLFKNLNLVV